MKAIILTMGVSIQKRMVAKVSRSILMWVLYSFDMLLSNQTMRSRGLRGIAAIVLNSLRPTQDSTYDISTPTKAAVEVKLKSWCGTTSRPRSLVELAQ